MIDDSLAADLQRTKETIERHERNLEKYKHEEQEIIQRFDGDIERFKRPEGYCDGPTNRRQPVPE